MFNQLKKPINLFNIPKYTYVRRGSTLTKEYEKEKGQWNKDMKNLRSQFKQEFWEEQTKVENDYIQTYVDFRQKKRFKENARTLNAIIMNSAICYRNMQDLIERQQTFFAKQKIWKQEAAEELLKKHSLLSMMDNQAKNWLTPENMGTELSRTVDAILPPTIISHTDYYNRLIRYAVYYEEGRYEEAENLRINKEVIDYKNKLLEPIFQELKSVIYHLSYTEEVAIIQLYNETMNRIQSRFKIESDQINAIKETLDQYFKKLITLVRLEAEKPENKIDVVERQLQNLVSVILLWVQYTDILYLSEEQVSSIIHKEEIDEGYQFLEANELLKLEDNYNTRKGYLFSKITENLTKNRLTSLAQQIDSETPEKTEEEENIAKELNKDGNKVEEVKYRQIIYEEEPTVFDDRETKRKEEERHNELKRKEDLQNEIERKDLEEISDDEDPDTLYVDESNKKKVIDRVLEKQAKIEQIKNENIYSNLKDQIADYKNSIVQKFDLDKKSKYENLNFENFDISSIIDINELEREIKDSSFNIFDEKSKTFKKEKNAKLMDSLVNNSKNLYDFYKPKLLDKVDIYDEDLFKFFEASIVETKAKTNYKSSYSVIMNYLAEDLKKIDENIMSPKERLKRKHLINLCDLLSQFTIKDAENLSKIFDLYKRPSELTGNVEKI